MGTVDTIVSNRERTYQQALKLCGDGKLTKNAAGLQYATKLIEALADSSTCARYLQGGVLARVQREELWRKEFPDLSFVEWAEKIGMVRQLAQQLVLIHTRAVALGLTIERLEHVGWTKARAFLLVAARETVDDWIELARTASLADVVAEVREARRAGSAAPRSKRGTTRTETRETLETFRVQLDPDQHRHVEATIEEAIELLTSRPGYPPSRGAALDLICVEWRANHLDLKRSLDWHLAQLQRAYPGIALTALRTMQPAAAVG
jgi:hypothetical protein